MNEEISSDNESETSYNTMIIEEDIEENLDKSNPFYLYLRKTPFIKNEKCLPVASVKPQIKGRDINELQKRIEKLVFVKEIHEDSGVETNSNESWEETNENRLYKAGCLEPLSKVSSSNFRVPLKENSQKVKRTLSDSRLNKPDVKFYNENCYVSSIKTFEVIKQQMSYNEFQRTEFDRIVSSCRQRRIDSKRYNFKPVSILRNGQMEKFCTSPQKPNGVSRIKETCVDADIEEHCTHAHLFVPKVNTVLDRKTGTLSSLV